MAAAGACFLGLDFTAFFAGFPAAVFMPEEASFLPEALTALFFEWALLLETAVAVGGGLMEGCAGSIGRIAGGLASRLNSASAVMEGTAI